MDSKYAYLKNLDEYGFIEALNKKEPFHILNKYLEVVLPDLEQTHFTIEDLEKDVAFREAALSEAIKYQFIILKLSSRNEFVMETLERYIKAEHSSLILANNYFVYRKNEQEKKRVRRQRYRKNKQERLSQELSQDGWV
jgi:hypothetical protein